MEIRDMAKVVETFRTKFMEGVAGTADRVAGGYAGVVANPGGMALHDMALELERLVGGILDGMSSAAVTEAADAFDSSELAFPCQNLVTNGGRTVKSSSSIATRGLRLANK